MGCGYRKHDQIGRSVISHLQDEVAARTDLGWHLQRVGQSLFARNVPQLWSAPYADVRSPYRAAFADYLDCLASEAGFRLTIGTSNDRPNMSLYVIVFFPTKTRTSRPAA